MTQRAGSTRSCGHDEEQFVTADEGTSHCPACEREADDPPCGDPRPDPITHPDYWTE